MRSAHFLTLALTWLLIPSVVVPSVFAQNSALNQLEQGLQRPSSSTSPSASAPEPGYLGFIPHEEADQGRGVRVESVKPGAPAAQGGMKAEDLITAVDGKTVTSLDQLDGLLTRTVPNQKIAITVDRAGLKQTLNITLGTKPKTAAAEPSGAPSLTAPALTPPASASSSPSTLPSFTPPGPASSSTAPSLTSPGTSSPSTSPSLLPATGSTSPATSPSFSGPDNAPRTPGIVAQPQTLPSATEPSFDTPPATSGSVLSSGRASLGVRLPQPGASTSRLQRGALIEAVNPGSPAEQAGLRPNQIIVGIDGKRVDSDDDLIAAIRARQPGQSVELQYRDGAGGDIRTVTLRLAQAGGSPAPGPTTPSPATPPRIGGFGTPAIPGTAGGQGRPLLDRIERMADNLSPLTPRPSSTVYDPEAFAALRAQVNMLENRLKALESKLGVSPSSSPATGGTTTPGFTVPGPQPTTPGFGAPSP